ncbi:MAG: S41 family peptidase [Bacteroidales bacterium]|nr:S41 family peptidase [Bacteroidales bacterium]
MKYLKLVIIVLVLTATTAFGQTKKNNFEITKSIDIYNNVLRQLNMYYVDEINPAELNEAAINAMLEGLDPYTVFIPESQIEDVKLMTTGEYGGIGATIQYFEGKVQIAEPYEGFPAAKAGLIPGDVFLEVNGIDVSEKTSSEVSELLKGTPGTTLKLKMKRLGEKEPITKELKREKIKIDNIPYSTVFDNGVGYAILSQFTKDCAKELKDVIVEMKKKHELKGFILDLRGNGGGLLNEAVEIVNMFVPKNRLVVYQKGKVAQQNYNHFTQHEPLDLDIPLVILVNEGSASASEIVSGSIQDFDRGVIVGQRTFGKGLVQNILPMSYNTQIKVTVAHYYLPSNRCIQEIDYSKKNKKNGADTLAKNDTLGQPFHTANGRVVYEGHGIQPDVKIEPVLMSTITTHLYAKNLFFKYANKFYSEHKSIKSPKEFTVTDETYNDFMQFVKDEGFTFTSKSEEDIKELEKTAKAEGYLDEIKPILDQAVAAIEVEKTKDLTDNRSEIEQLIKYEIVSRYYYQKGRIIATLEDDPELAKAFEVILNQEEYNNILKGTNQ